jgi:hypothetical protein
VAEVVEEERIGGGVDGGGGGWRGGGGGGGGGGEIKAREWRREAASLAGNVSPRLWVWSLRREATAHRHSHMGWGWTRVWLGMDDERLA